MSAPLPIPTPPQKIIALSPPKSAPLPTQIPNLDAVPLVPTTSAVLKSSSFVERKHTRTASADLKAIAGHKRTNSSEIVEAQYNHHGRSVPKQSNSASAPVPAAASTVSTPTASSSAEPTKQQQDFVIIGEDDEASISTSTDSDALINREKGIDDENFEHMSKDEYCRKTFELPSKEKVIEDFGCAYYFHIHLHGRMYITQNYVNFRSNVLGYITIVKIPFSDITEISRKNSAVVVPNAIEISTQKTTYFFTSLAYRDQTYKLLRALWMKSINKRYDEFKPRAEVESEEDDGYETEEEDEDDEGNEGDEDDDELKPEEISKRATEGDILTLIPSIQKVDNVQVKATDESKEKLLLDIPDRVEEQAHLAPNHELILLPSIAVQAPTPKHSQQEIPFQKESPAPTPEPSSVLSPMIQDPLRVNDVVTPPAFVQLPLPTLKSDSESTLSPTKEHQMLAISTASRSIKRALSPIETEMEVIDIFPAPPNIKLKPLYSERLPITVIELFEKFLGKDTTFLKEYHEAAKDKNIEIDSLVDFKLGLPSFRGIKYVIDGKKSAYGAMFNNKDTIILETQRLLLAPNNTRTMHYLIIHSSLSAHNLSQGETFQLEVKYYFTDMKTKGSEKQSKVEVSLGVNCKGAAFWSSLTETSATKGAKARLQLFVDLLKEKVVSYNATKPLSPVSPLAPGAPSGDIELDDISGTQKLSFTSIEANTETAKQLLSSTPEVPPELFIQPQASPDSNEPLKQVEKQLNALVEHVASVGTPTVDASGHIIKESQSKPGIEIVIVVAIIQLIVFLLRQAWKILPSVKHIFLAVIVAGMVYLTFLSVGASERLLGMQRSLEIQHKATMRNGEILQNIIKGARNYDSLPEKENVQFNEYLHAKMRDLGIHGFDYRNVANEIPTEYLVTVLKQQMKSFGDKR